MSIFSFHQKINSTHGQREISVNIGDLCQSGKKYDIVVVSAYKGSYTATQGTMIGNLYRSKGISVDQLSHEPEIDLRSCKNVWLSKETGTNLKRIACVELINWFQRNDEEYRKALDLGDRFLSLRMLLVWAKESGISISRVAMPFIGTGHQSIDRCFVAVPLLTNIIRLFDQIAELETVDFYEINMEKAQYLADVLEKYSQPFVNSRNTVPDLFISYSSSQQKTAYLFYSELEKSGISCWMAPDSIPHGSDYTLEIPRALGMIPNVLLLLSEEAEKSKWVALEISTSIGKRNVIFPCQLGKFPLTDQFSFMLGESQIRYIFREEDIPAICAQLAGIIKKQKGQ